ncbi:hypothetical protein HDV01_003110 [Terramyces sp. JEL0728]|nr:hypothetical protein HDV01_003110 [Terramyces sp. JEL0728]
MKVHPGGKKAIIIVGGQDATEDFEAIHGDGPKASKEKYCIGVVIADKANLLYQHNSGLLLTNAATIISFGITSLLPDYKLYIYISDSFWLCLYKALFIRSYVLFEEKGYRTALEILLGISCILIQLPWIFRLLLLTDMSIDVLELSKVSGIVGTATAILWDAFFMFMFLRWIWTRCDGDSRLDIITLCGLYACVFSVSAVLVSAIPLSQKEYLYFIGLWMLNGSSLSLVVMKTMLVQEEKIKSELEKNRYVVAVE